MATEQLIEKADVYIKVSLVFTIKRKFERKLGMREAQDRPVFALTGFCRIEQNTSVRIFLLGSRSDTTHTLTANPPPIE